MAQSPLSLAGLPAGFDFRPKSRCLIDHFLVPRALRGRVPDYVTQDAVAEGVDVYVTRPEALPFPSCNRRRFSGDEAVWGYFFTARPTAAVAGGPGRNARNVAGGGCWYECGSEKGFADDNGEVYAFRAKFAYYEDGGKMTPWRMKEYRLNEGAARFRGVAFHLSATNLVVWKVYYKEEPLMEYYSSEYGGENEVESPKRKRIKTGDSMAGAGATGV